MQPFGLMNFLNFALQASQHNQTPSMTAQSGENTPLGTGCPPNSSQESTTQQGEKETTLSQKEDAYWSFVEKHERTSQKIKRENR